jgi:putative ABC transport system permease protein
VTPLFISRKRISRESSPIRLTAIRRDRLKNLVVPKVQPFALSEVLTMLILKAMIQNTKIQTNSQANIGGLAIGMAVAILIGIWVYNEVRYTSDHRHVEQTSDEYRENNTTLQQKSHPSDRLSLPALKELAEKYAHLDSLVKIAQLIESRVMDMFSLKMLAVPTEVSDDSRVIVIPEFIAQAPLRYKTPINHVVKLNHNMEVRVTSPLLTWFPPDENSQE